MCRYNDLAKKIGFYYFARYFRVKILRLYSEFEYIDYKINK